MKKMLLKIFGLFFIAMAAPSLYAMKESLEDNPPKRTVELIAAATDKLISDDFNPKSLQQLQNTITEIFTYKTNDAQRIEALPFVVGILNEKAFNSKKMSETNKLTVFTGLEDFWRQLCDFLGDIKLAKMQGYSDALTKINISIKAIINTVNNENATETLKECSLKLNYINWILENLNPTNLAALKSFDELNTKLNPFKSTNQAQARLLQKLANDDLLTDEAILNLSETEKLTYFTFAQNLLLAYKDYSGDKKIYKNYLALSDLAKKNKATLEKIKNKENLSLYEFYQSIMQSLEKKVPEKEREKIRKELKKEVADKEDEEFEAMVQEKQQEQTQLTNFNFADEIKKAGEVTLTGTLITSDEEIEQLNDNLNLLIKYNKSNELIKALNEIQTTFFPNKSNKNYRWYYLNNHIKRFEDLKDFWNGLEDDLNQFNENDYEKISITLNTIITNMNSDALTKDLKNKLDTNNTARKAKKVPEKEKPTKAKKQEEQEIEQKKKAEEDERLKKEQTDKEEQKQKEAAAKKEKEERERQETEQKKKAEEEERLKKEQTDKEKQQQKKEAAKKEKEKQEQKVKEERERQEAEKQPMAPEELQKNLSKLEIQLAALHSSLPKKGNLEHPTKDRPKGPQGRKPPTRKKRTEQETTP